MFLELSRQLKVIVATTTIPNKQKVVVIILWPTVMATKLSYLPLYRLHLLVGAV
jgi:hypothetical protein